MINSIVQNLSAILGPQYVDLLHKIRSTIKDSNHVILYSEDRCFFLTALLATFSLKKEVFLPHCKAKQFITSITQKSDFFLTDTTLLNNLNPSELQPINPDETSLIF